jgi:hypothetical protein
MHATTCPYLTFPTLPLSQTPGQTGAWMIKQPLGTEVILSQAGPTEVTGPAAQVQRTSEAQACATVGWSVDNRHSEPCTAEAELGVQPGSACQPAVARMPVGLRALRLPVSEEKMHCTGD